MQVTHSRILIVGSGAGLSRSLSNIFSALCVHSSDLININPCDYDIILYTSCDPRHSIPLDEIDAYFSKNFWMPKFLADSNFQGHLIYFSSLDVAPNLAHQSESLNIYAFSKLAAERVFLQSHVAFSVSCIRVGALWPPKSQNNIFKAVYSERPLLSIDSRSSFFITPISLVVEAINYVISLSKSRYLANLFYGNRFTLADIILSNGRPLSNISSKQYLYISREPEPSLDNLADSISYDWNSHDDFCASISIAQQRYQQTQSS